MSAEYSQMFDQASFLLPRFDTKPPILEVFYRDTYVTWEDILVANCPWVALGDDQFVYLIPLICHACGKAIHVPHEQLSKMEGCYAYIASYINRSNPFPRYEIPTTFALTLLADEAYLATSLIANAVYECADFVRRKEAPHILDEPLGEYQLSACSDCEYSAFPFFSLDVYEKRTGLDDPVAELYLHPYSIFDMRVLARATQ